MRFPRPNSNAARVSRRSQGQAGFTLAEVLAALLFMAIVVPVAMEAFRIASLAGEVSVRKAEAMRVADRVLNESIVMTNWMQAGLTGTVIENGLEYRWKIESQSWPVDSLMQVVVANVAFNAGGREFNVSLNTLANQPATFGGALP